jgi:hypothetical protein
MRVFLEPVNDVHCSIANEGNHAPSLSYSHRFAIVVVEFDKQDSEWQSVDSVGQ